MIYCIVGPTGSGKTECANKLATLLNCPLINCDAFQIYIDMDIGTAKISREHPLYSKYHLIDFVLPSSTYSVAQYQKDFRQIFEKLIKDNKDIIIVGGTGLYLKAALYDYIFQDEYSSNKDELEKLDNTELFEKLKTLDPNAAIKIHINNRKRLIRAIDIALNSSKNKSQIIDMQKHKLYYDLPFEFLFINPDRNKLYENINNRVYVMIEKGLVEEVKNLLNKYELSLTAKEAIGYKEIISYLSGDISLNDAIELIKKRTRNYAKRQITFFKHQFDCKEYSTIEQLLKDIYG